MQTKKEPCESPKKLHGSKSHSFHPQNRPLNLHGASPFWPPEYGSKSSPSQPGTVPEKNLTDPQSKPRLPQLWGHN